MHASILVLAILAISDGVDGGMFCGTYQVSISNDGVDISHS